MRQFSCTSSPVGRSFWPRPWSTHSSPRFLQFPRLPDCPPPPARPRLPSIRKRFAPMCAFCRSICWKAAGPARAEPSLPPSTSPRSLRLPAWSRPATTAHTSSASRCMPCTPSRTRRSSRSFPPSGEPVDLAYGSEIVSKDQTGQETADFDAPIVFVGYGIHAPEYNWNDYAAGGHVST